MIGTIITIGILLGIVVLGIRIVRPTHMALVETFGKYSKTITSGFNWIIPVVQSTKYVNVTEQMVDSEEQDIITKDRLNARVDAQVYFKVKRDPESIKASQYNVQNYRYQIVQLAKTTLRNIIGNMSYEDANSKREEINDKLKEILSKEAKPWGLDIVRSELKRIEPPKNVQDSMNEVVKSENTKKAAVDLATARETEADGKRRAAIKEAEGEKQALILEAEGQKKAQILVAEAKAKEFELVEKTFKAKAQLLKKLEVTRSSLKDNSKIILTDKGINPQLLVGKLPVGKE